MSDPFHDPQEKAHCDGGCPGCARLKDGSIGPGGLTGWRLSLAAGLALLTPLALGVAGAVLARRLSPGSAQGNAELAGTVAGLVVGIVVAVLVARRLQEPAPEQAPGQPGGSCQGPQPINSDNTKA